MTATLTTLPNGLRVVIDSVPDSGTASFGVWYDVGSRHEAPHLNGMAHLLEHMVFKGTPKLSAEQVARYLRGGGEFNAYTTREVTAYYINCLPTQSQRAINLMAEVLINPHFDNTALELERKVILEELASCEDLPHEVLDDSFQEACYPNHPLGRPIGGTTQSVQNLSRDDLIKFYRTYYQPEKMVFSAAGDFNPTQVLAWAEQAFQFHNNRLLNGSIMPPTFIGQEKIIQRRMEQVQVQIGFSGLSCFAEDRYTLLTLNVLLGGTDWSRLFQQVREKNGLAYHISSDSVMYADSGMLTIQFETSPQNVKPALGLIASELKRVLHDISDEELESAKQHVQFELAGSVESPRGRLGNNAFDVLRFGSVIPTSERIGRLQTISRTNIQDLASQLFSQPVTVATIGEVGALEPRAYFVDRLAS